MTPEQLESVIEGLPNDSPIDLTKRGVYPIGSRVRVLPGVSGEAIEHDEDGDTVVRCSVGKLRHTLRILKMPEAA